MKKILLAVASFGLVASSLNLQAQDRRDWSPSSNTKKFRFGAYLAPTSAWMRSTSKTDDAKNYSVANDGSKMGFMYGLMAEYYFQPNYAIVTGLQMNMGGGKMTMDRTDNTEMANTIDHANFNYSLSYLEIPVAIKLRTEPVSNFRFFGQAGLTLGLRVAKKAAYSLKYYDADITDLKSVTVEKDKLGSRGTLNPGFAPINLQMNLGVGVEYPLTDKLAAYAGVFFNNGFVPDVTNPQNFELYGQNSKPLEVNSTFKDGNTRFNNVALRVGIFF